MPIYEFRCLQCGEVFELLAVKSGDDVDIRCPQCKGEEIERVMSRVSFNTSGSDSGSTPSLVQRQCSSGSCQTVTLPGHTR